MIATAMEPKQMVVQNTYSKKSAIYYGLPIVFAFVLDGLHVYSNFKVSEYVEHKPWLHTPTEFVELHAHASRGLATPRVCGYADRHC